MVFLILLAASFVWLLTDINTSIKFTLISLIVYVTAKLIDSMQQSSKDE